MDRNPLRIWFDDVSRRIGYADSDAFAAAYDLKPFRLKQIYRAAAKELVESNYRFTICDLVAVEMPPGGDGLQRISKGLLGAEIDIHYCYALITSDKIRASIVVHVDNPSLAATVLAEEGFHLLDEVDLRG